MFFSQCFDHSVKILISFTMPSDPCQHSIFYRPAQTDTTSPTDQFFLSVCVLLSSSASIRLWFTGFRKRKTTRGRSSFTFNELINYLKNIIWLSLCIMKMKKYEYKNQFSCTFCFSSEKKKFFLTANEPVDSASWYHPFIECLSYSLMNNKSL